METKSQKKKITVVVLVLVLQLIRVSTLLSCITILEFWNLILDMTIKNGESIHLLKGILIFNTLLIVVVLLIYPLLLFQLILSFHNYYLNIHLMTLILCLSRFTLSYNKIEFFFYYYGLVFSTNPNSFQILIKDNCLDGTQSSYDQQYHP